MKIVGKTAAEIFDSIRVLTQVGAFKPGQELPTTRDLATTLGVNRNTVSIAYKRLTAAGIAVTQGRLGTFIRKQPDPGEQEGLLPGSPLADLGSGNPNPVWLPDIGAALMRKPYRPRLYGEATVDTEMEVLARQSLTGDCPEQFEVSLTSGAVDAIERLLAVYLVAGDKVVVEDPCFIGSVNTLRIAGLQAIGVPVDTQGMCVERLEQALAQGAQAVIVTPRAHSPTGVSLSAARAHKLRAVLTRYPHVLVITDDHFSLLAATDYRDVIPPTAMRWALIRSVSKMLGPDLRFAFVASDEQTAQLLRLRLAPGTNWVSHLLQDAVVACLSSPDVAMQLAQAREDYARRRELLTAVLGTQGIAVTSPADGLNLWLPLPVSSQAVVLALARRGWLVRGGEAFAVQAPVAKARKARVSAVVSNGGKAALAKSLGADETILYTEETPEAYIQRLTEGRGFDVVIDTVGGANLDKAFHSASAGGRVAASAARSTHDLSPLHAKALSLHVIFMLLPMLTGKGRSEHGQILKEVAALCDADQLRPVLHDASFDLAQAAQAHALLEAGGVVGKVAVDVIRS